MKDFGEKERLTDGAVIFMNALARVQEAVCADSACVKDEDARNDQSIPDVSRMRHEEAIKALNAYYIRQATAGRMSIEEAAYNVAMNENSVLGLYIETQEEYDAATKKLMEINAAFIARVPKRPMIKPSSRKPIRASDVEATHF